MRPPRRVLLPGVATAVVAGVVLATPVTARAAGEAPVAVAIHQYQFHPDPLVVEVGQPVTWTNEDAAAHDVTSSSGPEAFGSGSLATGQRFTFTFEAAGTYTYVCTVHPDMVGSITVAPAPTSTTSTTTTTAAPAVAPVSTASPPTTTATTRVVPAVATVAAPSLGHEVRPFAVLLALTAAVVAGCLLLLGVGRPFEEDDA